MPSLESLEALPTRTQIDAHSVRYRPQWWRTRVPSTCWPTSLDGLPADEHKPRWHRISRSDVAHLAADHTAPGRVRLLVAAYVWGTGSSGFLFGRNTRWLKSDLGDVGGRLTSAAHVLLTQGAGAAYSSMLRGGDNAVAYVGPAFFTKYLYFTASGVTVPGPRPLILDRRVASALRSHTDLGTSKQGWSVAEYEAYLARASAFADRHGVGPDAVELALFRAGGSRT
ncbi:hypothetical protein WDZ16_10290 [Pseudokineococcus marinus]|uniref:Uncharacterized protein n=1 Tax=Pseudokineococcus marinus TaxID=351215 RepID=A0A849BKG8_9ACTN|nr:hypothetical protein [Pseudokineococcus marinus]NNH21587.1 hypothetical protein [Pseudokineococcus marinus]